jgi:hypothetical protein
MKKTQPATARGIKVTPQSLILIMEDRQLEIAWEKCSPRLAAATEKERLAAELSPGGYGIHWPLIDEDLSVNGLVRDAS